MLKINENVQKKFEEITKIKFDLIEKSDHKIKLATFDKFSVNDDINLKLLSVQGVNAEYVKLQSAKKTQEGKKVYLFMVKNDQIKSFYACYVEKTEKTLPKVKPETVSVMPTKSDNSRSSSQSVNTESVSMEKFKDLESKLDFVLGAIIEMKTESNKKSK